MTELPPKDAVRPMGAEEGKLRCVALLVNERPKLNPLKVLNAWNGLNGLNDLNFFLMIVRRCREDQRFDHNRHRS